ncbi:diacylglycerol acyltransferase domain-containing protein [Ditylenchus destructor]|uniref:diacylglycerol O-acyltransferase n=1 Tax=Ditylenchus destructor TaxID=166010 RepID=A0AAD4MP40_9BILA|nr:diacylglycerol acyltransferase domain-containing protein [Ditylenchus destructor]KAI1699298.1 diacylglycerol acyltransferase domain-containing protein [Ditylenchus destructor]
MLLYLVWMLHDNLTPQRGGRPLDIMYNSWIWRHFVDYFPTKLVKTTDLPPIKSYIFGKDFPVFVDCHRKENISPTLSHLIKDMHYGFLFLRLSEFFFFSFPSHQFYALFQSMALAPHNQRQDSEK